MQHIGISGFIPIRLNEIDNIEKIIEVDITYGRATTGCTPNGRTIAGPWVMCAYGMVDIPIFV